MQFRAAAEIRFRRELLVGSRSVEQTLLGGSKEDAESSGGSQAATFCHQTSESLVNQKQIRSLLLRKLNRFTFPRVKIGKRSIGRSRRPPYFDPTWQVQEPFADDFRGTRVAEFVQYGRLNQHALIREDKTDSQPI